MPLALPLMRNAISWIIVQEFAMSDEMQLPEAKDHLKGMLGCSYAAVDWDPVIKIVMDAENNTQKALEGLDQLSVPIFGCPIKQLSVMDTSQVPALLTVSMELLQLTEAEKDLLTAVNNLMKYKQIIGTPLTLEEMLNLVEEQDICGSIYRFENGDEEIVAQVNYEMAVRHGKVVEINDETEEEAVDKQEMDLSDVIWLCEQMECISIKYGSSETSLDLSWCIRKLKVELRQMESA
ncbi:hypothetical protein ID866_7533 [Astraeus odoratus]|nr:hypothetical protein ID866_7533 [Astraeus odoratus]